MGVVAFWKRIFAPDPRDIAAKQLYERIRDASRRPELYESGGVPDTIDGRYDMVVLHMFAVLRRLKLEGAQVQDLKQRLTDAMFADFDDAVRQLGVADDGVAKRLKTMAEGFYGRVKAYDGALEEEKDGAFDEAVLRNVFRLSAPAGDQAQTLMALYREFEARTISASIADLSAGDLR